MKWNKASWLADVWVEDAVEREQPGPELRNFFDDSLNKQDHVFPAGVYRRV